MTRGQLDTWMPYDDPIKTASILDSKRLGAQIFEGIHILASLLRFEDYLVNPKKSTRQYETTRIWKSYEKDLLYWYLKPMILEWQRRGFNWKGTVNERNINRISKFMKKNHYRPITGSPPWVCKEVCESHKSELVRRAPEIYAELFLGVDLSLPFIYQYKDRDKLSQPSNKQGRIKLW